METLYQMGRMFFLLLILSSLSIAKTSGTESSRKVHQQPVCSGDVNLSSQAQVDAFPSTYGCTEITGKLKITGTDITNIDSLNALTRIGELHIMGNESLTNLNGLGNLQVVTMDCLNAGGCNSPDRGFVINNNAALSDIMGLSSLTRIESDLAISSNPKLASLQGLENVASIGGRLILANNATLNNLDGLSSLTSVESYAVEITNNQSLISLEGLSLITSIPGSLIIINNASLPNLNGLESITQLLGTQGATLLIRNNASLANIDGLSALTAITGEGPAMNLTISDNPVLVHLNGLRSLTEITGGVFAGTLEIANNASLQDVDGLSSLVTLEGFNLRVSVKNNVALTNVNGLSSLILSSTPRPTIEVTNNPALVQCCGLYRLIEYANQTSNGHVDVSGNGAGCTEGDIMAGGQCQTGGTHIVCNGAVSLTTQAEVDAFTVNHGCSEINGNLIISGNDITNLDSLYKLTSVSGNLFLRDNPNLIDITGLSSLSYVGLGDGPNPGFHISNSERLTDLHGLESLTSVGGMLVLNGNAALTNIDALTSLSSLGSPLPSFSSLRIENNPALVSLSGLRSIKALSGSLRIEFNNALPNLNGLDSLTGIVSGGGNVVLNIEGNASLSDINALASFTQVSGRNAGVQIANNASLPDVNGLSSLTRIIGGPGASLIIQNNNSLMNINGLSSLTAIDAGFVVLTLRDNPNLAQCCSLYTLLSTNLGCGLCSQTITISGNGAGCTQEDILAGGHCCGGPLPQDKYVFAENSWGYAPHATNILVQDYEPGIIYELSHEDGLPVAGPQPGNVGLYVEGVAVTTAYNVLAKNPETGCEAMMSIRPVINILSEPSECPEVPANKELVAESNSVSSGEFTNILVLQGDEGVIYALRNDTNDSWVAGPYPSSVGLNTGPLHVSTTFNVLAIDEDTHCSAEMTMKVTVDVTEGFSAPSARVGNQQNASIIESKIEVKPQVTIYPNPGNGEFNLELTDDFSGSCTIHVRELSGKTVREQHLLKEGRTLNLLMDLKDLPKGMYVVTVHNAEGTTSRKLVIR